MSLLKGLDFEQAAFLEFAQAWSLVDLTGTLCAHSEAGAIIAKRLRTAQGMIADGSPRAGCFVSAAQRQKTRMLETHGYQLRAEALLEAARLLR